MATGGFHPNPVASGQSPGPANARPASGYVRSPASPQLGNYPPTSMPGYMAPPPSQAPGSIPRYSAPPFQPGARPAMFTPRPPIVHPPTGPTPRPMGGMRPLPPVLKPPGVMQGGHLGGPYEKPYTTVYVGKIAPTVEDTFLRSILLLCGGIKSWKRAQDPTTGAPKGFGFCEFESAEGVLRALRLLNKHNLDGQELVLNVNKDTREYLERYVARKENEKLLEEVAQEEDSETAPGVEIQPPLKPSKDDSNTDGDDTKAFGIVSEVDKKGDEDALQRLKSLVEERAKSRPLFRPLLLDGRSPSAREASTKSKDDELNGKHDEETSDKLEKMEAGSGRRTERDRERDLEREKDRELERFERERERERVRREKERKDKLRESERLHEEHEREWEAREREKERQRLHDKEREKERERERKREIKEQEEDSDDDDWKKRRYRGSLQEERRRRRQREKEEDIIDAIKEEQEIVEAKKRKIEDSEKPVRMEIEISREPNTSSEQEITPTKTAESPSSNGACEAVNNKDTQRESPRVDQEKEKPPPPKKLGFGLTGAGKRATLPSLFHQEEEEELPKDRKLRPLVPIDYSAEEMQAVAASKSKTSPSGFPPNIAAAAEFARSLSNLNEDDRKDGSRKHKDRSRKDRERERERDEQPEKPLDAKQLIDTIPKTKEELFSYPVDWAIYDKHKLHEKMRPWISKKIVEFLGEEETTFIDFIVNHTRKHVSAASMLQSLKSILDDEAEMFVLKMWRMLIFEIRRIETGLAKSHS